MRAIVNIVDFSSADESAGFTANYKALVVKTGSPSATFTASVTIAFGQTGAQMLTALKAAVVTAAQGVSPNFSAIATTDVTVYGASLN